MTVVMPFDSLTDGGMSSVDLSELGGGGAAVRAVFLTMITGTSSIEVESTERSL